MNSAPSTTTVPETSQPGPGRTIFWAALICGTMDISAAFVSAGLNGMNPAQLLRAVASAPLGAAAREGGLGTAAFGLALHYAIATGWTTLFYQLSRSRPVLTRQPVVSGLLYGTFVYLCMNLAVVPFALWFRRLYVESATAYVYAPRLAWLQYVIILGCIGLPIAFTVRWFDRRGGRAG